MPEVILGREIFQATEATFDDDGEWITIIKEGTSVNNRNYKRSTLERAIRDRVYENIRMFVDHSEKPPLKRSVRELVSGIGETKLDTSFPDGKARIRGHLKWFNDDFKGFAERAREHIGVSHDAKLFGTRSNVNGRKFEEIDEIRQAHSVDWVVYPSAGGGFEQFYAHEGVEMTEAIDWDAVDEEMLKKHKPELYQTLTARAKESAGNGDDDDEDKNPPPGDPDPDNAPAPKGVLDERAVESIVTRVFTNLNSKREAQAGVHGKVADLVNRSTLPSLTKNRVIASFDGAETFEEDKVKEAISAAKEELAAVAGPRIRNMGPSGNGKTPAKQPLGRAHEAIEAAFAVGTKTKKTKKNDEEEE